MVKVPSGVRRYIVTGMKGAGKTTFCRCVAEEARMASWDVAGIISLPRQEGEAKTGILALDLRSGETRLLASAKTDEVNGFQFCNWYFSEETLEWTNRVLSGALPCDLLIVDEIGSLELEAGRGMTAGLQALQAETYRAAIAVVRLVHRERFSSLWPRSSSLEIAVPDEAIGRAKVFFWSLRLNHQPDSGPNSAVSNQ